MSSWQKKSSNIIHTNPWFNIRQDEVIQPDGSQSVYHYIDKLDFALTIPLVNNNLILVEQFRYPIQTRTLEFPKGSSNPEESLKQCAKRELLEETGYESDQLTQLGLLYLAPGIATQKFAVFLAQNCYYHSQQLDQSESDLTVHSYAIDDVKALIQTGKVLDSETIASFYLFLSAVQ